MESSRTETQTDCKNYAEICARRNPALFYWKCLTSTFIVLYNVHEGGETVSPRPIENTERVSTYISSEQLELLRKKAAEKGMSVSGFIRMLILQSVSEN